MRRRNLPSQRVRAALSKHDAAIRKAFEVAIRQRRKRINMRALADAIENRGLRRAVELAGITRGDMFPLDQATRAAFMDGGTTVAAAAPAFAARISLDGNAPRAVAWAQEHVGGLITAIVDDNRAAIRLIIAEQLEAGQGPRSAAVAVRSQIGLTAKQAEYVENARRQLAALDSGYFTRTMRDRRFDSILRKAISANKPLSQTDIDRIAGRYGERLLKLRSEVIARTESITALRAGRHEGIKQAVEQGAIAADSITKVWSTTLDGRQRDDHGEMDGVEVPGLDTPFELPDGSQLLYPGDTSLGAAAEQVIQCRCYVENRVNWLSSNVR